MVGLLAAGCEPNAPGVDPALRGLVQPAVRADLAASLEKQSAGLLGTELPESKPRWFCAVRVVEARAGRRGVVEAGVVAHCEELGRRGRGLVRGTAEAGPWVVEVERDAAGASGASAASGASGASGADCRRVRAKEAAPDGAGHAEWVRRAFSKAGAAEVLRQGQDGAWDGEGEVREAARKHFRLPAGVAVRDV